MASNSLTREQQEALELVCLVIEQEPNIRNWFNGLRLCPENLRISAILQMTSAMQREKEDEALISAISALCNPAIFAAVQSAIEEL